MNIIAIDPGNSESAYVIFDGTRILAFGKLPNLEIRYMLLEKVTRDCFVAIEMVACYGMPVGEDVFDTCVAIGNFQQICRDRGVEPVLYKRLAVKMHLCHTTQAKDSNVIQALKDRFGDKGTKKAPGFFYGVSGDVWQAFALAVYVSDQS